MTETKTNEEKEREKKIGGRENKKMERKYQERGKEKEN